MPHRKKPTGKLDMRAALSRAEQERLDDKRLIANLFATYDLSRCGRATCARARMCSEPGVPCFDENRENLRIALLDLADYDIFADPDAEAEDDDSGGAYRVD